MIFGPRQIVARINQDQVISPQITLWNQQGSEVIQGTLLVDPDRGVAASTSGRSTCAPAGGRIPELKRVIVAYQNQIVMEETLDAALERIFPRAAARAAAAPRRGELGAGRGAADRRARSGDLRVRAAREHYQRALKAQREGDWALYGEEIRRARREVLERIRRR